MMKIKYIKNNLKDLLNKKKIHLNGYSGKGRFATRTADHTNYLYNELLEIGVKKEHIEYSNDAPRGGWSGEYVRLKNLYSFIRKKEIKILMAEIKKEYVKNFFYCLNNKLI